MWRSETQLNEKPQSKQEFRDKIRKYLKRSGVGDTARVRNIMFFALDHGGHFTFKELYEACKKSVSTADVDKLVDAGFLYRIGSVGNKGNHIHLYETTIGNNKPRHSHLQCTSCGEIIEFDDTVLQEHARKVTDYFKFEKHSIELQINGRCEHCCNNTFVGE